MADMCTEIRGIDDLKNELDRTRENLRDTDATIERLTGRSGFGGNRQFSRRVVPRAQAFSRGESGLFSLAGYDSVTPPPTKRLAGPYGRLGLPIAVPQSVAAGSRRRHDIDEDDDLPHKPSLQSSVVATPKDTKSRQDAIAEQQSSAGGDGGTGRNRRIFGLLLGTLVKFKEDERTKEQQAEKRKVVEEKLEEKQREEIDKLKRERFRLFSDRRRHRAKLHALEQKMELVEIHKTWETETYSLENYIRSKTRPHLFFLPKSHTAESQVKLDESRQILRQLIADRRKQLEEELDKIMRDDRQNELTDEHEEDGDTEDQRETEKSSKNLPDSGSECDDGQLQRQSEQSDVMETATADNDHGSKTIDKELNVDAVDDSAQKNEKISGEHKAEKCTREDEDETNSERTRRRGRHRQDNTNSSDGHNTRRVRSKDDAKRHHHHRTSERRHHKTDADKDKSRNDDIQRARNETDED